MSMLSHLTSIPNLHLPRLQVTWGKPETIKVPALRVKSVDLTKIRAYNYMFADLYRHTKDWSFLEQKTHQAVFIYCNMMRGGKYHHLIEPIIRTKDDEGLSINPYAFSRERYEVFQTKDGSKSYPVALPSKAPILNDVNGQYMIRGRVKGWLYFVRSECMNVLDNHMQNGVKFRRKVVDIQLPYRIYWPSVLGCNPTDEDAHTIQAWMYLGVDAFWGEIPVMELDKCRTVDPAEHKRGKRIYHAGTRKKWLSTGESYYLFDAWGVNNNK